ncbi:MAG: hypothetical protein KBB94_07095 [Legionellaceae bacterium]|nr:hypothetical protein [Legionellaceae bacterium]MBP9776023.1 hypothetical protein [Legionellaceae bacterium]
MFSSISGTSGAAGGTTKATGARKVKIEEATLQAMNSELEALRSDNERLRKKADELEPVGQALVEARQSISSLTNTNLELSSKHGEAIAELALRNSTIRELEESLQQKRTAPESIQDSTPLLVEVQQLRKQIEGKNLAAEETSRRIQQQAEEIQQLKLITAATRDVSTESEDMSQALADIKELRNETELLRAQVDEKAVIQQRARELQERVEELEQQLVALSEAHRSSTEGKPSVAELQQNLERLSSLLDEKNKAISEANLVEIELRGLISRKDSELKDKQLRLASKSQELQDAVGLQLELTRRGETDRKSIIQIDEQRGKLEHQLKIALEHSESFSVFPAALIAGMQQRQEKVNQAILHLKSELSSNTGEQTSNDIALTAIVTCLEGGLASENPQAYFDEQKDHLKTQLNALRGVYSVMNTALNAILSVLAVCSVVGIPALWFTGTWKNNAEKNGSVFAFTMFGAEQKAKCDIYEATQALGVTLGA